LAFLTSTAQATLAVFKKIFIETLDNDSSVVAHTHVVAKHQAGELVAIYEYDLLLDALHVGLGWARKASRGDEDAARCLFRVEATEKSRTSRSCTQPDQS
jgi:hypothetical protein